MHCYYIVTINRLQQYLVLVIWFAFYEKHICSYGEWIWISHYRWNQLRWFVLVYALSICCYNQSWAYTYLGYPSDYTVNIRLLHHDYIIAKSCSPCCQRYLNFYFITANKSYLASIYFINYSRIRITDWVKYMMDSIYMLTLIYDKEAIPLQTIPFLFQVFSWNPKGKDRKWTETWESWLILHQPGRYMTSVVISILPNYYERLDIIAVNEI